MSLMVVIGVVSESVSIVADRADGVRSVTASGRVESLDRNLAELR